jgi:hypothetical protein
MKFRVTKRTILTTEYTEIVEADSEEQLEKMIDEDEINFWKGYDDMDVEYDIEEISDAPVG